MSCPDCHADHDEDFACSHWVVACPDLTAAAPGAAEDHSPVPRALPPVPLETENLVGHTLRGFKLLKKLGTGGMATVYLGEQQDIASRVAIKVLHRGLVKQPAVVAQCYAEARAVNVVGHPNIVRIFSLGVLRPQRPYLVMEYLEGPTLSAMLRSGPVPVQEAIPLLIQVCAALEAAHKQGVIHRDIKPANILVTRGPGEGPHVKVVDFGAAKVAGALHADAAGGQRLVFGTPAYMAPEQWSDTEIDPRCDLYSLGVTSYLLLTGRLPFPGTNDVAKMVRAHRHEQAPPPCDVNPQISPALSGVILRMLAKDPAHRYASAADVSLALRTALVRPTVKTTLPKRSSLLRLASDGDDDGTDGPPPLPVPWRDTAS